MLNGAPGALELRSYCQAADPGVNLISNMYDLKPYKHINMWKTDERRFRALKLIAVQTF